MGDIHISAELVILGGGASFLAEFLRALILRIEDYPRIARIWKYLPSIFGAASIFCFPSIVPTKSFLILLAHGAGSPAVFYIAYPLIKALLVNNVQGALKLPVDAAPALPPVEVPAEGEKS